MDELAGDSFFEKLSVQNGRCFLKFIKAWRRYIVGHGSYNVIDYL